MTIREWNQAEAHKYVARVFVCGYEQRSQFVAKNHLGGSKRTLILDYNCVGVGHYDQNMEFFTEENDVDFIVVDEALGAALTSWLDALVSSLDAEEDIDVLLDVSSCSRSVMAIALLTFANVLGERGRVTCAYALSAFDSPPDGELPSHISEPVVGDLSGWSDDLSRPPCAVIGLGFEPGRALGCIDYLEIPEVRLFMPRGVDRRFESAVHDANSVLIDEASENALLPYDVLDASTSYQKLESLIHGLLPKYRPVLIPLGPKIFAALSIILAIKLHPLICVWRTSSGAVAEAIDRHASGEIAVFTTKLTAKG
ncbi:hypothetical protein [Aminobacter ciceronei]|jgi:hypothetical protein|uniref:hypothetical protein n=1 Tax=Aminobacter ciceronei TaxID=150723 RepID=UPI003F6F9E62